MVQTYMPKLQKKNKDKRWIQKPLSAEARAEAHRIADALSIHPTVAELLYLRGFRTRTDAQAFLCMEKEMLCNPFDMKDMPLAVERIAAAVSRGERIAIYGDYDVDGVTAVSTLYLYLSSIGADVTYYIPNRTTDGYGVSRPAIEALAAQGVRLIVTVDTGITATEETRFARELGVDFVITDHHECRAELPEACAVVNPHRPDCPYPFKDLAGVGVVFKLISAYEEHRTGDSRLTVAQRVFSEYSDLVAIGTIADVMPIRDENRIIVCQGLRLMERSSRTGLVALMNATATKGDKKRKSTKITSSYIGYTLAPRINAAGRILCASIAVELFLTDDYDRAYAIAEQLCRANKDRQNEENKIIREAAGKLASDAKIMSDPVIVLDSDTWHHGVIGIVSSRLTEKYCRPSILVSFEGMQGAPSDEDVGKGSGRSIKGMNLVDALCACSDVLVKFGGHELAAGLSVTRGNLPLFRQRINDYARQNLTDADMTPTLDVDLCIDFSSLNLPFAEALQILEPYGVGNPVPTFMVKGCRIAELTGISDNKHTRFVLSGGGMSVTAMFFSVSPAELGLCVGDPVDAAFTVDVNEWMGRRSIQLILKDIRLSETEQLRQGDEEGIFQRVWAGESFSTEDDYLPTRDDFTVVYRQVVAMLRTGRDTVTPRELLSMLSLTLRPYDRRIGYVKLRIILKVFMEMNIIGMEELGEAYRFFLRYSTAKTDLEKSTLLRRLRSQQRHP